MILVLLAMFGGWVVSEGADLEVSRWRVGTNGSFHPDPPAARQTPRITEGSLVTAAYGAHPSWASFFTNLSAPEPARAWNVDRWTSLHGLPNNRVRTLCFGADGYLWIGTTEGLGRFDGRQFVVFTERNAAALEKTSSDIRSLVRGPDGALWIAARQGLSRLDHGGWEVLWAAPAETKLVLRDLALGADGKVWVGTHLGLRRWMDGRLETEGIPATLATAEIVYTRFDSEGGLWVGTAPGGVFRWNLGSELDHTVIDTMGADIVCTGLAAGVDGTMWVGMNYGVLRCHKGTKVHLNWPAGRESGTVYGLHPNRLATGPSGNVWISMGLEGALGRLGAELPEPLITAAGSTLDDVSAIAEDTEGNVWCGTRAGGLFRMRRQKVVPLALEEPVTSSRVLSVTEGPGGSIWCGVRGGVVVYAREHAALIRTPFSNRSLDIFSTVFVDPANLWTTFQPSGLLHFDLGAGREGSPAEQPGISIEGVGFRDVRAICRTRDGAVWSGSGSGLHRGPGHWVTYGVEHGLGARDVRAIHQARDGALWVGTFGGGLSRWRDAVNEASGEPRFETWRKSDGLSDDRVLGIHEDGTGAFWAITHDGLTRWDSGRLFAYGTRHGLPEGLLNAILEDEFGRFWISCNSGIFRVDRAALESVARGERERVQCVLYDETDGMLASETNGEQQPSACRAANGRLYFATQRGLAVIDPREFSQEMPPPEPRIEEVLAAGTVVWSHPASTRNQAKLERTTRGTGAGSRESSPALRLRLPPAASHSLAIRYSASALSAPERVRFEHWLVGLDPGWQAGNPDRVAYYGHVAPGQYQLRLRAANHHGVWSEAKTAIDFQLEPRFWQTWMFRAVLVVFGAGAVVAIQARRLWIQREYLRLEHEHALELERTRLSRDMHDQLGASLSRLGLLAGGSGATQRHVREVLQELRELIWTVSPKYDSVSGMADFLGNSAQQYLEAAGIAVELRVPTSLPDRRLASPQRHQVAAAFKESLRNVVQHSGASMVTVDFELAGPDLCLRIRDDGRGFDVALARSKGSGLAHLHQRMAELKGTCRVESRVGADHGTTVELRFPLGAS
ncbi:MAG: hypothetical protein IT581_16360 [Verrucomicrobiales bacterium]|nr:hypothetical protein [Verrucomicrobiales bacterium]